VEEGPEARLEERDCIQLRDPERADGGRHGNGEQERGPDHVGPNEDRPAWEPVDPGPSEQADQENAARACHHEVSHLGGAGSQGEERDERERGPRDDRPEL